MFRLKTTALAVLALGSSTLFAGTMGPVCAPGNVTVACESTGWGVGISALYLTTVYDADFDYFGTNTINNTTIYSSYNADWNWGYKIEAAYRFNTGNDLNVNWSHLDYDHRFIPGTSYFNNANGLGFESRWDAVNAEVGQTVDFSMNEKMRFHGGVQYVQLKNNLHLYNNNLFVSFSNTEFQGFGPRAGIDMRYGMSNGFGVYAKSAGALLVGTGKFRCGSCGIVGSKDAMVPELEAKLGADFAVAMGQGQLTIDAGYMWFNYFNAEHTYSTLFNGRETDFSASGPYAGLKFVC